MTIETKQSLALSLDTVYLSKPFHISGYVFESVSVLRVGLARDGFVGRGEAAGVYYTHDTPDLMIETLERMRAEIEAGLPRSELRSRLPSGGARNALDCAMWELDALRARTSVWRLAGIPKPRPLVTTMTLSADSPDEMAAAAIAFKGAKALKLKLSGEADVDMARLKAVRAARPDVWLGVDANQGYNPKAIEPVIPVMMDCRVMLLEQPFARGCEEQMREVAFPLPTAADESCLDLSEMERVHPYFDVINIKLDKCGGLTEGLAMSRRARELDKRVMVGCMGSTGMAMAPAFVLGQSCDVVDLDGPIGIRNDCSPSVTYSNGEIDSPPEFWGGVA